MKTLISDFSNQGFPIQEGVSGIFGTNIRTSPNSKRKDINKLFSLS